MKYSFLWLECQQFFMKIYKKVAFKSTQSYNNGERGNSTVKKKISEEQQQHMLTVGQNIKHYRDLLHISQGELAKRCGHDTEKDNGRSWVYKIEKGINDVPLSELKVIAKVLGVKCTDLMCKRPEQIEHKSSLDSLKNEYGDDVFSAVQLFLKLDNADRVEITNNIRFKLSQEKYSIQDGSKIG